MSLIPFPYEAMQPPQKKRFISKIGCNLIFFLSLCVFVLLITLMLTISFAPVFLKFNSQAEHLVKPNSAVVSPLYSLLSNHEQKSDYSSNEVDAELLERINTASSFDTKSLFIAETVVPVDKKDELVTFVAGQIQNSFATDVVSSSQASAIIKMVELSPKASGILKEEKGLEGSLRSSAVLALIREHEGNLHFIMLGLKMEPHLGWNWIPTWERNSWNNAVSRLLRSKLMKQARGYLACEDQSDSKDNLQLMNVDLISDPRLA
ncbi:hypothetical protein O6H91_11G103200 [Diphasiastrum complanatum]|uniref:Uncharacterized protein n=1 Tax=Diphasiastrum complanatum TaxID=34168 RepID=A0ACC2CCA6_DIPCM|nr:hypothetical protein O6H91_11G103200 [Diphasiastrum complanatum]